MNLIKPIRPLRADTCASPPVRISVRRFNTLVGRDIYLADARFHAAQAILGSASLTITTLVLALSPWENFILFGFSCALARRFVPKWLSATWKDIQTILTYSTRHEMRLYRLAVPHACRSLLYRIRRQQKYLVEIIVSIQRHVLQPHVPPCVRERGQEFIDQHWPLLDWNKIETGFTDERALSEHLSQLVQARHSYSHNPALQTLRRTIKRGYSFG